MQFIRFNSCKKLVNLLGFLTGLSLDVFLRIIFNQNIQLRKILIKNKMILDNLVVVFSMFL